MLIYEPVRGSIGLHASTQRTGLRHRNAPQRRRLRAASKSTTEKLLTEYDEARMSGIAEPCHHHRERKSADTIGTVPVPWAGHFQR